MPPAPRLPTAFWSVATRAPSAAVVPGFLTVSRTRAQGIDELAASSGIIGFSASRRTSTGRAGSWNVSRAIG